MSLDNTMKVFSARLDEITTHQEFISVSLKLGSDASNFWDRSALADTSEISDLVNNQRAMCNRVRTEDLGGALSVQLFAAVEWFIGQILVKSVRSIGNTLGSYENLPEAITRHHVILTGKALSKVFEALPHEKIEINNVFQSLASCVPGSTTFNLNDEIFSYYLPNIDSNSLVKCLSRIGLKLSWDKVGRNKDLQILFSEGSVRKTGKLCIEFLDDCARNRNAVAHRGDGSATIQFDDLSKQLTFFRHLSVSIREQIDDHLTSLE